MVVVDQESNEELRVEERGGEGVRGEDGSGGGATAVEVEGGAGEGGLVLRRLPAVKSLSDKVLKAEVLWVLKTVESNFSFNASEDIVEVLKLMDPDSIVLKTMKIKRMKTSYILTHGLYPYYLEKLVKRIQDAVGFCLGTDSATFKLHGLTKMVDIVIR